MPQRQSTQRHPVLGLPGIHCPLYTRPTTLAPNRASPPITILRHRCVSDVTLRPLPLRLAPLLPAFVERGRGKILRLIFVKGLLPLNLGF